jgi:DNA-binding NarL/FixJ family response regulator
LENTNTISDTAIGVWGRHELFVSSLVALLSNRGARAYELDGPVPAASGDEASIQIVLLESPFASDVERAVASGLPVLALVERVGSEAAVGALALGARGVLAKNAPVAELSIAIRRALKEQASRFPSTLTARQQEVLTLIAAGLDNAQIAQRLNISTRTARAHVSGVLERLGVENRTQAAVTAVRNGWVN